MEVLVVPCDTHGWSLTCKPRGNVLKELADGDLVVQFRGGPAAGMQRTFFGQCYQLLDERAQFLGLGDGGNDPASLDERDRHIAHQSQPMGGIAPERPADFSVLHNETDQ